MAIEVLGDWSDQDRIRLRQELVRAVGARGVRPCIGRVEGTEWGLVIETEASRIRLQLSRKNRVIAERRFPTPEVSEALTVAVAADELFANFVSPRGDSPIEVASRPKEGPAPASDVVVDRAWEIEAGLAASGFTGDAVLLGPSAELKWQLGPWWALSFGAQLGLEPTPRENLSFLLGLANLGLERSIFGNPLGVSVGLRAELGVGLVEARGNSGPNQQGTERLGGLGLARGGPVLRWRFGRWALSGRALVGGVFSGVVASDSDRRLRGLTDLHAYGSIGLGWQL